MHSNFTQNRAALLAQFSPRKPPLPPFAHRLDLAVPVAFTTFGSATPLSKRFDVAETGIVNPPDANMTEGRTRRVSLYFSRFGEILTKATASWTRLNTKGVARPPQEAGNERP